jgi:hypothetical protein
LHHTCHYNIKLVHEKKTLFPFVLCRACWHRSRSAHTSYQDFGAKGESCDVQGTSYWRWWCQILSTLNTHHPFPLAGILYNLPLIHNLQMKSFISTFARVLFSSKP